MPSQRDLFEVSGPTHLTSINWNCPNHQRSVAASLVQGVYVLERDRQQNRYGPEARAPAWYQYFHFIPMQILVDDADSSIFGVVYQYTPPVPLPGSVPDPYSLNAPTFVVAFRGTIAKKKTLSRDLALDFHILKNGLENTTRFRAGYEALNYLVYTYGHQRIWLAGHSLGSAIAILAAKSMAKLNVYVKSFLFNPPFLSAPIEMIKDTKVKAGIRIANSFVTAGVASVLKKHSKRSNDCFDMLALWVPQLYVNHADKICSEYIGYFEHRKKMEEIGAKGVGKIATKNSVRDLVLNVFGNGSEPLHLFPSAILNVNWCHSPDFKTAHGIHQWWRLDLNLDSRDFQYCSN
ncbi:alpha/beta-Hydrolases superfamily protein [Rhynchospora pubera]|uniref:Alpha/beta-Hydrolases superfamily protein n=1 Tax=Rhynchospora pubera TaxID=906938 RepID=A0AAV8GMN3_9POAL|nr:alpha/beta-Hydrolases superfamily protein [Rhynchospora pubera]